MPAEWAPHRGTWLSWPHRESSWPGKFEPVPGVFVEIVRHLAPHEEVHINVTGPEMAAEVRARLAAAGIVPSTWAIRRAATGRVYLHHNPTNDAWCRDHGPIFVQRETASGRRSRRSSTGATTPGAASTRRSTPTTSFPPGSGATFGIPVFHPGIVMEGGSIDVNGAGTLLTTESCLLNPNRNPGLRGARSSRYLRDYLGVRHILWLGDGIEGDDTDGHVDDLTRFVDETTVVTVVEDDPRDANYAPLQENLERLRRMTDQDGAPLRVVTLPMPPAMHHDGQRLPASYANFYIANGWCCCPPTTRRTDEVARATLQRCFPTRRVVPSIPATWSGASAPSTASPSSGRRCRTPQRWPSSSGSGTVLPLARASLTVDTPCGFCSPSSPRARFRL